MPSTYSALLRTELVAIGEQAGTWGGVNNNNIGSFLEAAIAGTVSHNTAGAANTTLTALNGTADEARSHVIKLTGLLTGSHNVICPLVSKTYLVINNTTGAFAITFIGATGTGVVCPQGSYMLLYCDGTNVYNQLTNTTLVAPNMTGSVTINGVANQGFPAGTRILFQQTAAPTGWTKDTTAALNDTALRIVTGAVSSGGSNAFSTAAYTPTISNTLAVASHTLVAAEIPAHTHDIYTSGVSGGGTAKPALQNDGFAVTQQTGSIGGSGGHSHGLTGGATSSVITLALKYNDVIIASKDA